MVLLRKGGEIDDSPICTVRVNVESDSSDSRQAVVVEGVTLGRSRWSAQEPRTAHHICVWLVKESQCGCAYSSQLVWKCESVALWLCERSQLSGLSGRAVMGVSVAATAPDDDAWARKTRKVPYAWKKSG